MTARGLVLVRHSLPNIRADVPAAFWNLSTEGIARARTFATRVECGSADRIFTSADPKAVQTADALAGMWKLPVEEVAGLHEHERPEPRMMSGEQFEATIRDLFARPSRLVFGAETADAARLRFTAAVMRLVDRTDRDVIVVSHGTVISLFAAAHAGVDAFEFWKQLDMPCAVRFGLPELRLQRLTMPRN